MPDILRTAVQPPKAQAFDADTTSHPRAEKQKRRRMMKKKFFTALLLALLILPLFSTIASAQIDLGLDIGPKPSVTVTFKNLGEERAYATLLKSITGAYSSYYPSSERNPDVIDEKIWEAFENYTDPDGFYFSQVAYRIDTEKEVCEELPPSKIFKILVYYPDSGRYAVSDICECYAYDTYYTVDMKGGEIWDVSFSAERSYRWGWEVVSFFARVALTVAVEILLAFKFGFRSKSALGIICTLNGVTHVLMHVLVSVVNYRSGPLMYYLAYLALEITVTLLEAGIYAIWLKDHGGKDEWKPLQRAGYAASYGFTANAVSFAVGLIITNLIPGIV